MSEPEVALSDRFTNLDVYDLAEARICELDSQPLALGDGPYDEHERASRSRRDLSDGAARKRDRSGRFLDRVRNPMGKYPFITAMNRVLADSASWYAEPTRLERRRKFGRIHDILQGLRKDGRISTTSPKSMTEQDVIAFLGWCKEHLDNVTSLKYLRYLEEILQSTGNGAVLLVRSKHRRNLPRATAKPIRTLAPDQGERLLGGEWSMEDPFLDSLAKAAIALYLHTGLRSGELRNLRLLDLDLRRTEVRVSSPKGKGAWANGTETSPIMPGAEVVFSAYLDARMDYIWLNGLDPDMEPLFPYLRKDGQVTFWTQALWTKLKSGVESASGVSFKWKDLRPTFAQEAKDKGVPIEAVSKALRHSSTVTTERYYSRVRSETAFSLMRQAWEAPVAQIPKR